MNPQTTSTIAALWVLVGLAAVLIMLEIQGNPKKRAHLKGLTLAHRALGVLFILVYIAALFFMIIRIAFYHQEPAPRTLIHACLALSLLPTLGLQWLNRMAQKDLPNIRPFEMKRIILFLIEKEKGRDVPVAGAGQDLSGKDLVQAKCTVCHKLDRVYGAPKDMEFW
ncbi:MAG: hypothetical protein ABII06_03305, partial [Pseudomonadota bacterium]